MKFSQRSVLFVMLAVVALFFPGSATHAGEKQSATGKHSLWKVQGKKNSVYVFGSIHFLKKEFYPLPQPVEEAYRKSSLVVFETDIEKMQTPEAHEKIAKVGKLPEDESLDQKISPETYEKLQAYLKKVGIPEHGLDGYRPWMTAVALLGIELQNLGFDPEQGVEKYFLGKAQQDKKAMAGLETVDFQISLFGEFSKGEQEEMLKETLAEVSRFKTILDEMIEAWKTGNDKALDKLILEEMRGFPNLYKKLLLDRNKNWADSLEKMLNDEKDIFVTVGYGHLVGKESVIELLQKKGFKIEQL